MCLIVWNLLPCHSFIACNQQLTICTSRYLFLFRVFECKIGCSRLYICSMQFKRKEVNLQ